MTGLDQAEFFVSENPRVSNLGMFAATVTATSSTDPTFASNLAPTKRLVPLHSVKRRWNSRGPSVAGAITERF
jgi:hypothetical protein